MWLCDRERAREEQTDTACPYFSLVLTAEMSVSGGLLPPVGHASNNKHENECEEPPCRYYTTVTSIAHNTLTHGVLGLEHIFNMHMLAML